MKIGILVGKRPNGKYEVIGEIGDITECKDAFNQISADGGIAKNGKTEKKFVELIVSNLNREPVKRRKC